MRARVHEAQQLIELTRNDRIHGMAVFTFDLDRPFHQQSFEEEFVA
jgi:hypothetical protein